VRPEIEAYLHDHGAEYTAEAVRGKLIEAGHDPAEVDAALAEWRRGQSEQAATPAVSGRIYWMLALAIQLVVLGVSAYQLGRSTQSFANGSWIVLAFALLLGLGITGFIGRSLVGRRGLWVGLALPLASALLLGGTCLNMFGVLHL
jgi:hypothetical protein